MICRCCPRLPGRVVCRGRGSRASRGTGRAGRFRRSRWRLQLRSRSAGTVRYVAVVAHLPGRDQPGRGVAAVRTSSNRVATSGCDRAARRICANWAGASSRIHLLVRFPHDRRAHAAGVHTIPWRRLEDAARVANSCTGYPIVDAGLRDSGLPLDAQPRPHDRASFLVKDLLLPWQAGAKCSGHAGGRGLGEQHAGWQWSAGCGADAAHISVFNPVSQGAKFDPEGGYVRRWVPELRSFVAKRNSRAVGARRRFSYPAQSSIRRGAQTGVGVFAHIRRIALRIVNE